MWVAHRQCHCLLLIALLLTVAALTDPKREAMKRKTASLCLLKALPVSVVIQTPDKSLPGIVIEDNVIVILENCTVLIKVCPLASAVCVCVT